jgi:hypothetical protein
MQVGLPVFVNRECINQQVKCYCRKQNKEARNAAIKKRLSRIFETAPSDYQSSSSSSSSLSSLLPGCTSLYTCPVVPDGPKLFVVVR